MISVVIPALNEEKLLPDCLESLRNQDFKGEYEIIVADNGSTDNTANIARGFGARVVSCAEKQSVFYARQVGAEAACGDIIAQADADTIYPRDWLKRIADQFAAHPEVVALVGRFFYKDPPFWARVEYCLRHIGNRLTPLLCGRPLVVSGATLAFRRQAFLDVNGYRGISYAPDQYGIAGRLSKRGKVLYDKNLCVFTSSRRVQKPLAILTKEFVENLFLWAIHIVGYRLRALSRVTIKARTRKAATQIAAALILIIAIVMHGYFIPSSQVFGKVYYKGNTTEKVVALTFDDGPNEPYTSQILDILAQHNVKATFFIIGKNAEFYPETARRIVAEGHVLGNHSYSHNANHALSRYGSVDLDRAQEVIFNITGVSPYLYRPPHGRKLPSELQEVKRAGMIEVNWSVSTSELDPHATPLSEAQNIVSKVHPGDIILLHDGYGTEHGSSSSDKSLTVEALLIIIEQLQAEGYRFVTVPELLGVPAYNN